MQEDLLFNRKNGWEDLSEKEMEEIFKFSDEYIYFLNKSKTEREAVVFVKEMLENNGFRDIEVKQTLSKGDKVYFINREKSIYAAVIGNDLIEKGLNIIGGHIDSPRLDLKPNPLYEDTGFAYLKTHYYGGIKKYQWTAIPLAIHGVFVKANGEKIHVNIGEEENDPIFTITDLLPHLANEQMEKKLKVAIEGENLNLLIGSIPNKQQEEKETIKFNIMKLLNEKYGIKQRDFVSSEIEIVPAFKAKSLGFDKSMIAGYGQDDRVCSYTLIRAILDLQNSEKTAVCILSDKEEIGSMGNTGMESQAFDMFISEILNKLGINKPNLLEKIFFNSKMLSADVDAGLDPIYANVSEKNNASLLGHGIVLNKYTGARGKAGASDANAEYVAQIRNIFESENIPYQVSEMGKIDIGGGGTIAYILANKGIEVIDCGVPVLSMHSPYEVTSKFDVYCSYKAYKAFYNK
ncbi:MAG: aminopeptidase [Clostridia bacterium]|jgi:aspartyl aminopeptidase|nr:aminopeptidase [Clostridia bacterium]